MKTYVACACRNAMKSKRFTAMLADGLRKLSRAEVQAYIKAHTGCRCRNQDGNWSWIPSDEHTRYAAAHAYVSSAIGEDVRAGRGEVRCITDRLTCEDVDAIVASLGVSKPVREDYPISTPSRLRRFADQLRLRGVA